MALVAPQAVFATDCEQDVFDHMYKQSKMCWCTVASAKIMLADINGSASSQATLDSYMTSNNKYSWSACADGSRPHDPRGWAHTVYYYTPPGEGWQDYKSASDSVTDRTYMDWELVYQIRATGEPAGVSVYHGAHAMVVVGYKTAQDPFTDDPPQTIKGFHVVNPWFEAG